ncbi:MAG: hypothetical protein ACKOTB_03390, partial [Planctomycetia bacterium]
MSLGRDKAGTLTYRGQIAGSTHYDFGIFGSGDGPSFRGNVAFGPTSLSFSMQVGPILGAMRTLGPFTWSRTNPVGVERPDPIIARLVDGVLTLSAGDDPLRYGDAGGQWYGSILNESFLIEAVRDADNKAVPGAVRVRSQGVERTFTGVVSIVANGG